MQFVAEMRVGTPQGGFADAAVAIINRRRNMTLELTYEEHETLLDLLRRELDAARVEEHRTDRFAYRAAVHAREQVLAEMIRRLNEVEQPA